MTLLGPATEFFMMEQYCCGANENMIILSYMFFVREHFNFFNVVLNLGALARALIDKSTKSTTLQAAWNYREHHTTGSTTL